MSAASGDVNRQLLQRHGPGGAGVLLKLRFRATSRSQKAGNSGSTHVKAMKASNLHGETARKRS